ncbi:hypothetical protein GCM10009789_63490 [Kribbella sancticallisti]|uniref:Condensation domain-containing protein n=1 Tax=Kribbella sancticallisti TaxID=460087 RepID=A0ABN2E9F4_9ACTN
MRHPTSLWQTFALELDEGRPGFTKGPWFTMNAVLSLDGELDADVLARTFHSLQRRHEALRTEILDDRLQLVHPEPRAALEVIDEVATHAPVALETPVRLRLAGTELALHLHHLVSDPVTLWETVSELAAGYTAALAGESLPPVEAQYWQYSMAEAEQARRIRDNAHDWWKSRVGDAKVCQQPAGSPGSALAFREDLLTASEVETVERLTRQHRGTPLITFLAALTHGMNPHVGAGETFLFTTLFGKRDRPAWQRVLGPCIVPSFLAVPRPGGSLAADVPAVREAVVGCGRYARFPSSEVNAWIENRPRTPFFEYVPQQWPGLFRFGPVSAKVVSAAGPKDTGLADAMAIRVRKTTDGVLTGHFSADGIDWTEPLVHQVRSGFRTYLLAE